MRTVVDALAAECDVFVAAARRIEPDEWAVVTNCPPWDVKELIAHVYGSTVVVPSRLLPPIEDAPMIEAADYYRRDERGTVAYRSGNVDRWRQFAAAFASGEEIVQACERDWSSMIEALRAEDPSRLIGMSWHASMPLDDFLVSRVIGVAAHGIDLSITLERPRKTTPEALAVARPAFVSLLGAEPPDALLWSDQDLLEFGTGRRPLGDHARAILGPLAARFPLLS